MRCFPDPENGCGQSAPSSLVRHPASPASGRGVGRHFGNPLLVALLLGTAFLAGCTLFGDRPCETGRYSCPATDLEPAADLGAARACTLAAPCTLPPVMNSSPADVTANLVAVSGRAGDAWMVGTTGTSQGVLLHAQPGQATRQVATLPIAEPRALTTTLTGALTLVIASQGSALYQYDPLSAMLTALPLATGSCQGRLNPAGTVNGVWALSATDLWLVGAPTNDAAAGLFRVHDGSCQVLPELDSAGLSFAGVWGATASTAEPADRMVWTVGDSGAAVRWSFKGPDGVPATQRFATASGAPLRAVSGSTRCPAKGVTSNGQSPATCTFMISHNALYSAAAASPEAVALPAALSAAELTSLFVDGDSVWLVGTLAAAGLIVRYQPGAAAWSYLGALPGGALHAAWGAGDGNLWVVGDQATVLYVAKSP